MSVSPRRLVYHRFVEQMGELYHVRTYDDNGNFVPHWPVSESHEVLGISFDSPMPLPYVEKFPTEGRQVVHHVDGTTTNELYDGGFW